MYSLRLFFRHQAALHSASSARNPGYFSHGLDVKCPLSMQRPHSRCPNAQSKGNSARQHRQRHGFQRIHQGGRRREKSFMAAPFLPVLLPQGQAPRGAASMRCECPAFVNTHNTCLAMPWPLFSPLLRTRPGLGPMPGPSPPGANSRSPPTLLEPQPARCSPGTSGSGPTLRPR